VTPFSPGVRQRGRGHNLGDPAWISAAGATPGPLGPRTSRTQHPCGLRRPRSAEQGGCAGSSVPAGPDTRSFPAAWPFDKRRGHLREGRRLGASSIFAGESLHAYPGGSSDRAVNRPATRRGKNPGLCRHGPAAHPPSVWLENLNVLPAVALQLKGKEPCQLLLLSRMS
jgi:hypothetical protein